MAPKALGPPTPVFMANRLGTPRRRDVELVGGSSRHNANQFTFHLGDRCVGVIELYAVERGYKFARLQMVEFLHEAWSRKTAPYVRSMSSWTLAYGPTNPTNRAWTFRRGTTRGEPKSGEFVCLSE